MVTGEWYNLIMPVTQEEVDKRLSEARNIWLSSVRHSGAPHLVPIWFVAHDGKFYLCTAPGSVKARNVRANERVALALEDGSTPIIYEGRGCVLELKDTPQTVIGHFKTKYDWDILTDNTYTVVIEVTPAKRLSW